jgi:hypothetical protein
MSNINSILSNLSFTDRMILNQYVKQESFKEITKATNLFHEAAQEREQIILKQNEKVWEIIEGNLMLAMRENKISEERIDKILKRMLELTRLNENTKLSALKEQPSRDFEILSKDEYRDLIEELLEGHCKGCMKHDKHCNVYKLMKKHSIPGSSHKNKCKYSY